MWRQDLQPMQVSAVTRLARHLWGKSSDAGKRLRAPGVVSPGASVWLPVGGGPRARPRARQPGQELPRRPLPTVTGEQAGGRPRGGCLHA